MSPARARHAHVDIVVDDHLALGGVEAVQPASVLGKRAFPRDRHGNEKGIETGIIEALAEIAPGRDNDAFLGLGNRGETRGDVTASMERDGRAVLGQRPIRLRSVRLHH
jgi:hypothetical protein